MNLNLKMPGGVLHLAPKPGFLCNAWPSQWGLVVLCEFTYKRTDAMQIMGSCGLKVREKWVWDQKVAGSIPWTGRKKYVGRCSE